MIGSIKGTVKYKIDETKIILETSSGIGYELFFKNSDVNTGDNLELYVTTVFKEVGQELFGHKTFLNKKVFEILLKVKGVGPKTAYNLYQTLGVHNLCNAIQFEKVELLKKVPGIGTKTAEQIVLDLKKNISSIQKEIGFENLNGKLDEEANQMSLLNEATMALVALGLSEKDALLNSKLVLENTQILKTQDLVKEVLKRQKQKH